MLTITESEFVLMKEFIEKHCGIHLEPGKEYLIETRLSDLVIESGSNSFQEFHYKARTDNTGKLKNRIIDAMTTNETLWFRDDSTWTYIKEKAVQEILEKASSGSKVRIWSAAASTGQEAYSLLMLLDETSKKMGKPSLIDNIQIIGTDISSSALFLAISARYDSFAIKRGLPEDKRDKYFKQEGNVWIFDQELKKRVKFSQFNLQNSFMALGSFDLILLRYVVIYFSESFKRQLFKKIAGVLKPSGVLLLGATETLRGLSDDFEIQTYKNGIINRKK